MVQVFHMSWIEYLKHVDDLAASNVAMELWHPVPIHTQDPVRQDTWMADV